MTESPRGVEPPRPVLGGCLGLVVAVVAVVAIAVFTVVFLESGADRGRLVLRDYRSYEVGTAEFVGERNLYIIRLGDGSFVALFDLDHANREARGQRCRVRPVTASDAALPGLLERYEREFSARAAGATLLFREDCNGAVYDATGLRLDDAGPNLDQYPVGLNEDMELVIDMGRRMCSIADGEADFATIACPR